MFDLPSLILGVSLGCILACVIQGAAIWHMTAAAKDIDLAVARLGANDNAGV